jgi:transcriptional regulator GlxA family with amidase domain
MKMTNIQTIAVVGYERSSEQDTITPLEVFRGAAMVLAGQIAPWPRQEPPRTLEVKLVSLDPGNISMQMGTKVVPDAVLQENDLFDLLYVPGGIGAGKMTLDKRMIDAIVRHYEAGKIVAANCSGVGILSRAGILGHHPVTCVAAVARKLRAEGANVPQPRRMWQGVPDARIWTTSGSYGVNGGTVALVAHYFGHEVATMVGMMFDTVGGLGQQIFEDVGPEFYYYPDLEAKYQDYFEPTLLPAPGGTE